MKMKRHGAATREEGAVLISLDNLLSYPWIAERVEMDSSNFTLSTTIYQKATSSFQP